MCISLCKCVYVCVYVCVCEHECVFVCVCFIYVTIEGECLNSYQVHVFFNESQNNIVRAVQCCTITGRDETIGYSRRKVLQSHSVSGIKTAGHWSKSFRD